MTPLVTAGLRLVPFTPDLLRAATEEDRSALAGLLGARVPDAWPNRDFADALPSIAADADRDPTLAGWTFFIVRRAEDGPDELVGEAGFKGPPDAGGGVEVGYGLVPAARGRGLATEAAGALVGWALGRPDVRRVLAECEPDNTASARVLARLGFRPLAPGDDGLLRFERTAAAASSGGAVAPGVAGPALGRTRSGYGD